MKRMGTEVPLGDASLVAPAVHAGGAQNLVELDPDHPGFKDVDYRARRDRIARLALDYQDGAPVPDVEYTEDEHGVWRCVWNSLEALHAERASAAYLRCARDVGLPRDRIPQLSWVNAKLKDRTGFAMLPVAGLVAARTFLGYLGRDVFLSTQYIRHASRPLYTPEPDVVHELVGHAASFADPQLAALNRAFGRATRAADDRRAERLSRLYWHTLEFGLVREDGRPKAVGAGLLSSAGELATFDERAALLPFDPERASRTPYDPTDYQPILFVAGSLTDMVSSTIAWLEA